MPRMKAYIEENKPFNQLVENKNIKLIMLKNGVSVKVFDHIYVTPFEVPHRNENSETVGYQIRSLSKSIIYLPDIDSWEEWNQNIINVIKENDILFLDGTFYDKEEIKTRNIDKIPHPTIKDSMKKFSLLDEIDKNKVNFIHLNHTNNILRNTNERSNVINRGFKIASDGMKISI